MTEEELNGFKELAESINQITQNAFLVYEPQVDRIYRNKVKDKKEIESIIEALLDYSYDDKVLMLFKRICQYYYKINPTVTYEYVMIYRDMWDDEYLDKKEEENTK
ncbi:hypothetical protein [Flavobacterium psychrophilum]|uniref:hypothetical protein n=1 Tax=Flavobacterium psychrophilum TaxID=96345 RepID=UPI000B7C3396|nr:hypothetical protein [Flavobacterium psychrophilum]EKT4502311.1 hypothetical protein [Flavobacterium psychrophilum]MBF2024860.1 hypothetical protein [Flavobacterium psychrophilum]MCB5984051.1 hypothetical protein [Flavobacterium psychrophilum]MCB5995466.1 hypothetical protein [Flavobacterium psychrophilum]MCB5997872.1 hypothetical protein [Flavobacterium psychrophilum]